MSGGYFDYQQYKLDQMADEIDGLIFHNGSQELDQYGQLQHPYYPPDIIEQFKVTANRLRETAAYVQRIDWLVSGDDGEDCFRSRLGHDLKLLRPYEVDNK